MIPALPAAILLASLAWLSPASAQEATPGVTQQDQDVVDIIFTEIEKRIIRA